MWHRIKFDQAATWIASRSITSLEMPEHADSLFAGSFESGVAVQFNDGTCVIAVSNFITNDSAEDIRLGPPTFWLWT